MLLFRVCLSRSCIVLKRQKILTRLLLHTTAPCLSQIALKFGLHWSTPFFPNCAPKWPTAVYFSVGDIRWQLATRMVRDSAMVAMESLQETTITLSNVIADPLQPPLPPNGGPKCTAQEQLRGACCHLTNTIDAQALLSISIRFLLHTTVTSSDVAFLPNYVVKLIFICLIFIIIAGALARGRRETNRPM